MSNFILSRPWRANDLAIKFCYGLAGCLLLLNIHFSAMSINDIAAENGATGISSFEALTSVYIPAIFVSAYCFLAVGFLSHPMGIPSVLSQIQTVQNRVKTPLAMGVAYLVSVGLLMILVYWLVESYRFDIYTTQLFLGTQGIPLFNYQQLPTWAFIAGPEVIMVIGNGLNTLNKGGGSSPSMKSAAPQQTVQVPHQRVQNPQQQRPQPRQPQSRSQSNGQQNPWSSL